VFFIRVGTNPPIKSIFIHIHPIIGSHTALPVHQSNNRKNYLGVVLLWAVLLGAEFTDNEVGLLRARVGGLPDLVGPQFAGRSGPGPAPYPSISFSPLIPPFPISLISRVCCSSQIHCSLLKLRPDFSSLRFTLLGFVGF
jgi:hypothetical protein